MRATKCVTCRGPAAFRFCSNECFLRYSRTRADVHCAICQYDPQTGRIGNASTNVVCEECKAAEENQDWREPARRETVFDPALLPIMESYPTVSGRRLKPPPRRTRVIFALLREHSIRVPMRNVGVNRTVERWVWQSRPLNLSEIAFLVGCSRQAVLKTVNRALARSG